MSGVTSVLIYAGSYSREKQDRAANMELLGGVYGAPPRGFAVVVEVPDDLLSRTGRNLVTLMGGDFTGGPVRSGMPQAIIRRRRVSVMEAARQMGHPLCAARLLMDTYGEESVGENIVDEYLPDMLLPADHHPAALARSINRLSSRIGLYVRTEEGTFPVDPDHETHDRTMQCERWGRLLRRAQSSIEATRSL